MSQTLDHIRQEIRTLRPAERFDLWRDLAQEFEPPKTEADDDAAIEAAWDTEIESRVKEIEEGRVELVSADEAIAHIRSKLAARRACPFPIFPKFLGGVCTRRARWWRNFTRFAKFTGRAYA